MGVHMRIGNRNNTPVYPSRIPDSSLISGEIGMHRWHGSSLSFCSVVGFCCDPVALFATVEFGSRSSSTAVSKESRELWVDSGVRI